MWFSTLDLVSGYWQVEVYPEDREKTAFVVPHGLYEFRTMPFGLCNAPSTFQRLMELVLAGLRWEICLAYLDDIVIFGSTFEEHLERLRTVLDRLRASGLRLKPSKCQLFRREVRFLGHVVTKDGVVADPERTEGVRTWPQPTNATELRSFLGLASYYRRFVRDFGTIAAPLNRLTEKGATFIWTEQADAAFRELKLRLTSAPVLAYPQFDKPFILDTDASNVGIGGVLSQIQDGKECVIAYGSRSLTKSERNYCVTRRELLPLVSFTRHFRCYLLGRPFTARTDHKALEWLQKFKEPEGQVARWIEQLQQYDFSITHRAGEQHGNADGLSRIPCTYVESNIRC